MILKFLVTTLATLISMGAFAAPKKHVYDNTDITDFVKYFEKEVRTVKKSFTTYNWSTKGYVGEGMAEVNYAKRGAVAFWDAFGSPEGRNNMYGTGLYTAVDAAATYGYGGGGDGWLAQEITFPVGLRMLDLQAQVQHTNEETQAMQKVASAFLCTNSSANNFLQNGGASLTLACRELVTYVFQDILKIDAFAYGYSGAINEGCDSGGLYLGQRAFVIIDPEWLKIGLVNHYTAKSLKNTEGRIRFQTAMLLGQASFTPDIKQRILQALGHALEQNPNHDFVDSQVTCTADTCEIKARLCKDLKFCKVVTLGTLPRKGGDKITAQEAAKSVAGKLLWSDLEGQPKSSTIKTWLRDNKFGCDGSLPYENLESGDSK